MLLQEGSRAGAGNRSRFSPRRDPTDHFSHCIFSVFAFPISLTTAQPPPALHFPSSSAPSQSGSHYHTYRAPLRAYFAAWKPTERSHILVKLLFSVL